MVVNEGVLDVFLNFLCSLQQASPKLYDDVSKKVVVFVGQRSLVDVIQALGVRAFFSPHLGPIPSKAAGFYGDKTFGVMMWLKAASVYLTAVAGYNLLFQDVDLVWMENALTEITDSNYVVKNPYAPKDAPHPVAPVPIQDFDIVFMDDGARTPRFSPFYFNSGFYFVKHSDRTNFLMERMLKSVSEIAVTHSHQSVLTKYTHEALDFAGLTFTTLEMEQYPTGYLYHHDKHYLSELLNFKVNDLFVEASLCFIFHLFYVLWQ